MGNTVGGSGGNPFQFSCPSGSYVTAMQGRAGSQLDAIQVSCQGGMKSPVYGGGGGDPWGVGGPSGFSAVGIYADDKVNGIAIQPMNGAALAEGTQSGGKTLSVGCGSKRITGIRGRSGSMVDNLGFDCEGYIMGYPAEYVILAVVLVASAIFYQMMGGGGDEGVYRRNRPRRVEYVYQG